MPPLPQEQQGVPPLLPSFEESKAQSEKFGDRLDHFLLRQPGQAVAHSVDLPKVPKNGHNQGDHESPLEEVAVAAQEVEKLYS